MEEFYLISKCRILWMNTRIDQGVCSALISLTADCYWLECKCGSLLLPHLVVWWPIKAGCIHRPAELRAPSNNVDPLVPLLLSAQFTICCKVNCCSIRDYFIFINNHLRLMSKGTSILPNMLSGNTEHNRCCWQGKDMLFKTRKQEYRLYIYNILQSI